MTLTIGAQLLRAAVTLFDALVADDIVSDTSARDGGRGLNRTSAVRRANGVSMPHVGIPCRP
jgi:hypothetical protein